MANEFIRAGRDEDFRKLARVLVGRLPGLNREEQEGLVVEVLRLTVGGVATAAELSLEKMGVEAARLTAGLCAQITEVMRAGSEPIIPILRAVIEVEDEARKLVAPLTDEEPLTMSPERIVAIEATRRALARLDLARRKHAGPVTETG